MHDPLVVAFEIRRPWPSRRSYLVAVPAGRRDQAAYRRVCDLYAASVAGTTAADGEA